MRRFGFTLIELLIVVAIIAILAVIAVPNFLEAQVRAKVARVEAELRHVAMSLEAYNIDEGVYPMDWAPYYEGCFPPLGPSDPVWDFEFLLYRLTTPIAYMTTLPYNDPFNEDPLYPSSETGKYFYVNDAEQPYWAPSCGTSGKPRYTRVTKEHVFGGRWFFWLLKSVGPDRHVEWWYNPLYGWEVMYDASNGTVSLGEIERCGP
jgi:prepilin-type N-terminal cleavage/methylation domain-containing protein